MKRLVPLVVVVALVSGGMAQRPQNLSDVALNKFAMSFQDNRNWSTYPKNGSTIGFYRDVRVIAEVRCSDVCPDYTRMVIRYAVDPGPKCAAIDGREVTVAMPISIAVQNETFCVPPILAEKRLYTSP
jgi:hypothetical protein